MALTRNGVALTAAQQLDACNGLGSAVRTRTRIGRCLALAAQRNPVDLAEDNTLATITPKALGSGTAGLTQGFNLVGGPSLFAISGGVATSNDGSNYGFPCVSVQSSGNFNSTKNGNQARLGIYTDAVSMDFVCSLVSTKYRVLVNGQYVGKTVRTDGLGGTNRLNVALGDTSRKLRRVDIEIIGDADNTFWGTSGIATVFVGANDTLMPPDTSNRLKIAIVGDSFTAGAGASFVHNAYGVLLGYLLGGVDVDVRLLALGGTGWVNSGAANYYNFGQRSSDLSQTAFDMVIFAGGFNDTSLLSSIQANVVSTLTSARTLLPNALFVVLGSWAGYTGPSSDILTAEANISAGVTQFADANTVFVPVSADTAGAWINSANGVVINKSGASGGGSPDNTHPGDVGHAYLARRANAAIRTALWNTFGI